MTHYYNVVFACGEKTPTFSYSKTKFFLDFLHLKHRYAATPFKTQINADKCSTKAEIKLKTTTQAQV